MESQSVVSKWEKEDRQRLAQCLTRLSTELALYCFSFWWESEHKSTTDKEILSKTYAFRALAMCVGGWQMREFEKQTSMQVDSSWLAEVTCLALYAWFPSNLFLSVITASSSWEGNMEQSFSPAPAKVNKGSPSRKGHPSWQITGGNRSHYGTDITIEQSKLQDRARHVAGYTAEQAGHTMKHGQMRRVTPQDKSHHKANDHINRLHHGTFTTTKQNVQVILRNKIHRTVRQVTLMNRWFEGNVIPQTVWDTPGQVY